MNNYTVTLLYWNIAQEKMDMETLCVTADNPDDAACEAKNAVYRNLIAKHHLEPAQLNEACVEKYVILEGLHKHELRRLKPQENSSSAQQRKNEPIKSKHLEWDMKHNIEHLYRYVKCPNENCSNTTHSQDHDAPRHKIEGYSFYPEVEKFHCEICGEVSPSILEFNEDSNDYIHPNHFTVFLSGYTGKDRSAAYYFVTANTPRNAYAAAIRKWRNDYDAYKNIYPVHIATYQGHLSPMESGQR